MVLGSMKVATKPEPFLSYSANHEDVMLNRIFGEQATGFFVDVGAAHPLFESDTRALYDRGWRGINIEPTSHFYRDLVAQRPRDLNLNLAVSDEPGALAFDEVVGTGLSTANAQYAALAAAKGFEVVRYIVPARTLREILQEAQVPNIDVLKVDVEGLELQVMRSNDWSTFRPRVILSEGTVPESPVRRNDGVSEFLASQGYRHVYFDGLNDFYVERDFAIPPEVFDRPLNIFDRYISFAEYQLSLANTTLTSEIENLHREQKRIESTLMTEITNLKAQTDNAATYTESLASQLRQLTTSAKSQAGDLARAYAELISMRKRCEALGAELDSATMGKLLSERDTQSLQALQGRTEAQARSLALRLEEVYASNSWRVTRPLRALARPRRTIRFILSRLHLL